MKCCYFQHRARFGAASILVFVCTCLPTVVDVVVFPKDPSRVKVIDQLISDNVQGPGKVSKVTTSHRPDYLGIECWRINADDSELENLKTRLLPGDVSMISRLVLHELEVDERILTWNPDRSCPQWSLW